MCVVLSFDGVGGVDDVGTMWGRCGWWVVGAVTDQHHVFFFLFFFDEQDPKG